MARIRGDRTAQRSAGPGIDEDTSMLIDRKGPGTVDGDFANYVIEETASTARVQVDPNRPLIHRTLRPIRLQAGQSYHLGNGGQSGSVITLSVDGSASPALTPADPYR
ncbi:hypothetical protein [Pseudomarimonas salicorniae]|uniref:Uncharacterized protein n=1 Tax=Pseudomarimonas salicorniae TaxID=2933270 RepID=A0ABT0GFY9_9GAMM|nr:hypothetical protein [Lysobacter sp. CAU 1642]MCK7593455.1 hypothetical protein [Lysobacter sp. CAU 1642]